MDRARGYLQWVAFLTMVLDHVGVIWFPDVLWMRVIGRVAMPVYAWLFVVSWDRTSDQKRYVLRLVLLACFSQLVYVLAGQTGGNMILTMALCGLAGLLKRFRSLVLLLILAGFLMRVEYGVVYFLMWWAVWRVMCSDVRMVWSSMLLFLLFGVITVWGWYLISPVQVFALLGVPVVLFAPKRWAWSWPCWAWRVSYPCQWVAIACIRFLLGALAPL